MGESTHLWPYKIEQDRLLLSYVSSINLACGFHAGDAHTMHKLVEAALTAGVAVGAHPGFEDRDNFGRTNVPLAPQKIYDVVLYQVGALDAFLKVRNSRLHHVKPHGALYNMAVKDKAMATAICKAIYDYDNKLLLYGLSGSQLIAAANEIGLTSCSEVFADRTYQDDGSLTPRTNPQALITNTQQALKQVLQMVQQQTITGTSGKEVSILAETICIHSDGEHALEFAKEIRNVFDTNKIEIRSKKYECA